MSTPNSMEQVVCFERDGANINNNNAYLISLFLLVYNCRLMGTVYYG